MKINLAFEENRIIVTCEVKFSSPIESLNFTLNKNLTLLSISDGKREVGWDKVLEYTPTFRVACYEYKVWDNSEFNQVVMTYEGTINGWCNFIQENAKALNFYSVWYPQELSEEIVTTEVLMKELDNYQVIKGTFDKKTDCWYYKADKFDCQILAFKKGYFQFVNYENLSIYYLNRNEEKVVNYIKYYYEDVLDYYEKTLFKSKVMNKLNLVSLSLEVFQGAYFREELIVFTNFLDSDCSEENLNLKFGEMMAHELAHCWCTGADVDSWEDWLNETTAEWSALLYARHRNKFKLFDNMMNPKLDEYLDLPAIKTTDGSRPMGVHSKGALLFYFLYEKYGVETIEKLLQIFVNLRIKTTTAYLTEIKQVLSPEIAWLIEKNLGNKQFEL